MNMSVVGSNALTTSLEGLTAAEIVAKASTAGLNAEQQLELVTLYATDAANYSTVESLTALSASQTTAIASTNGLTAASKGLWVTLKSHPYMLVTTAVMAGVMAYRKYQQAQEDSRQAAEDAANTSKEASDTIEGYTRKYEELRVALLAAKGNEEETYNVKKQLLDLQTELNEKYGDEYGHLNLVIDAYKDQTEAIRAYRKEAAKENLTEHSSDIRKAEDLMTKDNYYDLSSDVLFDDSNAIIKTLSDSEKSCLMMSRILFQNMKLMD